MEGDGEHAEGVVGQAANPPQVPHHRLHRHVVRLDQNVVSGHGELGDRLDHGEHLQHVDGVLEVGVGPDALNVGASGRDGPIAGVLADA